MLQAKSNSTIVEQLPTDPEIEGLYPAATLHREKKVLQYRPKDNEAGQDNRMKVNK